MKIDKDISLKLFNTFGIDVLTKYFCSLTTIEELQQLLIEPKYAAEEKLVLGGGSNLLFTRNFNGLMIKMDIKGIHLIKEDFENAWIKVGAGENWHQFVLHSLNSGFSGLENLSLIPGTVGAAPLQNIGAYGVEVKELIESVEALEIETGRIRHFVNEECQFAYRNSIFKSELKNKYIILGVIFRLNKKPNYNIHYGAIRDTLKEMGVSQLTSRAISNAVIKIRQSKLPDPSQIGNAGSFFKNPVMTNEKFIALKKGYSNLPGYQISDKETKIPAGWLIEQSGWKGVKFGNAGVHEKQALVLVNHGNANGKEIKELALKIQNSILEKFEIKISPEVNIF